MIELEGPAGEQARIAAATSLKEGIGINKLRDLTNGEHCKLVLWVGSKRLIKRKLLDKFLEDAYTL